MDSRHFANNNTYIGPGLRTGLELFLSDRDLAFCWKEERREGVSVCVLESATTARLDDKGRKIVPGCIAKGCVNGVSWSCMNLDHLFLIQFLLQGIWFFLFIKPGQGKGTVQLVFFLSSLPVLILLFHSSLIYEC